MRQTDVRKLRQELLGGAHQWHQVLVLDPKASSHLLHHQLGVEEHLQAVRLPLLRRAQTLDQRQVLGPVVGGGADVAAEAAQAQALVVLDDHSQAGGARIAARGAVGVQPQRLYPITRMRPQFSQRTSSPRRSCWSPPVVTPTRQALQEVPTTSATGGRTRIFS